MSNAVVCGLTGPSRRFMPLARSESCFQRIDFFSPASSIVIYELKNGLMCSFQRCPRALLFPALFWRAQPMAVIELGAMPLSRVNKASQQNNHHEWSSCCCCKHELESSGDEALWKIECRSSFVHWNGGLCMMCIKS